MLGLDFQKPAFHSGLKSGLLFGARFSLCFNVDSVLYYLSVRCAVSFARSIPINVGLYFQKPICHSGPKSGFLFGARFTFVLCWLGSISCCVCVLAVILYNHFGTFHRKVIQGLVVILCCYLLILDLLFSELCNPVAMSIIFQLSCVYFVMNAVCDICSGHG